MPGGLLYVTLNGGNPNPGAEPSWGGIALLNANADG